MQFINKRYLWKPVTGVWWLGYQCIAEKWIDAITSTLKPPEAKTYACTVKECIVKLCSCLFSAFSDDTAWQMMEQMKGVQVCTNR